MRVGALERWSFGALDETELIARDKWLQERGIAPGDICLAPNQRGLSSVHSDEREPGARGYSDRGVAGTELTLRVGIGL